MGFRFQAGSAVAVASSALLIACGSGSSEHIQLGSVSAPVIGGELAQERDSVMFLNVTHRDGGWSYCSGTLLSPSVLLTAKHCVASVQPGTFTCSGKGDPVVQGDGAGFYGATADASAIEVYRGVSPAGEPAAFGARVVATAAPHACHDDLALVVLDRSLSDPSAPLRMTNTTESGELLTVVGYGRAEEDSSPPERRERGGVRVLEVGRLNDATEGPSTSTPSRTLIVGGGALCFGDSGGPSISEAGAVVGVHSRISGDCLAPESRNTFTLVAGFADLITEAFTETNESPTYESGAAGAASKDEPAEPTNPAEPTHPEVIGGAGGALPILDVAAASDGDAFRCSLAPQRFGSGFWALVAVGLLAASVKRRRRS